MALKTDGTFTDTSRDSGVRERNRTANKQGGAPSCMKKKKKKCNLELLSAPPNGNSGEQVRKQ